MRIKIQAPPIKMDKMNFRLLAGAVRYRKLLTVNKRACSSVSYPLQLSSVSSNHAAIYEESIKNPERFWGDLARRRLKWFKEFDRVMECDMSEGRFSWFSGGKINVSGRCMSSVLE